MTLDSNSTKISILLYSLGAGGAERVVSILLRKLSVKYNIKLVLMNSTIFYDIPPNVEVVFLEKSKPNENGIWKFLKLPFLGWKYKKIIKDCDISLSFMNRPNYINVFARLFGSKKKIVISERGTPSIRYGKSSLKGKINIFLVKHLYKIADLIIANSKGNTFDLKKNFKLKNVRTIYNFIEERNCNAIHKNEKLIFISVGRMDENKNHQLTLEAFEMANISNTELWLIGDGSLRKRLEKKAIESKFMKRRVRFFGMQKNVFEFLNNADCFILSSNSEGFPNVLLEALSCELPVISTDCRSGPREILAPDTDFRYETKGIELAKYGILVPVGNVNKMAEAMKIIYENKKLRNKYRNKAKERAEDFSVDKILTEWEEVLENFKK